MLSLYSWYYKTCNDEIILINWASYYNIITRRVNRFIINTRTKINVMIKMTIRRLLKPIYKLLFFFFFLN